MYEINTSDYVKTRKILIDGHEWTMNAPGAGDELALGQAERRAKLIDKKIAAGNASDEEYDTFDKLEDRMFKIFARMFKDSTPENSQVTAWLNSTPMVVIYAILEDIKKQFDDKDKADEVEAS